MSGIAILRVFLMIIEVLSAFLLIVLVLMQKSKSQGMGVAFGGAMGESLFGAQMGNVLTKATVILAVVFLVNTTLLAMIGPAAAKGSIADSIPETSEPVPTTQPQMPPAMPTTEPIENPMPPMPPMPPVAE